LSEVELAVETILARNRQLCLMQCNTNYTGSLENFGCIHLNVLRTYANSFPDVVLGLSDHTPGHTTVLGAVALGARVVEKHFTDDTEREGPDHGFAMDPTTWREMVLRTRELELALGTGEKRVEPNEAETVVVQRRCLRATRDLECGAVLARDDIVVLRPAPADSVSPARLEAVVGRRLTRAIPGGEHFRWGDFA
jgi:N-acetylneuraminate synthase